MKFLLQPSHEKSQHWVCTDVEHGIVCIFQEGKFNETQHFTFLDDVPHPDALALARLLRQLTDWLISHHPNIL